MTIKTLPQRAAERICTRWLKTLGMGFHPDTRGSNYDPPLSAEMVRAYDDDMAFLFSLEVCPYATGLKMMERLGMIEIDPEESE